MRRLGQYAIVQNRTASPADLLRGRAAAPIRDSDPHLGRVSSDDGVTLLPSRDCEVSINQSQVDSGAQPKKKPMTASAFVCKSMVELLVARHRRKLHVPDIDSMIPLFKDERAAIKRASSES